MLSLQYFQLYPCTGQPTLKATTQSTNNMLTPTDAFMA